MNDIRRVIRAAAWRLWIVSFLKALAVTLSAGLVGVILARMVEKSFGVAMPWRNIFIGAGAGVLLAGVAWSLVVRRKDPSVAREVDERAGLRESLSTALCVERSTDPWAKVVIETAQDRARRVRVAEAIPIKPPRFWPVPPATGLVFALVWFTFPQLDLTGKQAVKRAEAAKKQEVVAVKTELQADRDKLKEMLAKTKVEFKDDKPDPEGVNGQKTNEQDPESLRRQQLKQLTNLAEQLQQEKDGQKSADMQALKEAMQQLRQPGPGPMDELSRNMARGDFQKARQALEQLNKKIGDGSLSPDQKEQLKKQLENMAGQLDKLAQNQDELAKKMEQAGMDKKTAEQLAQQASGDPESVRKALDKLEGMSDQQKQDMLEMIKSAIKAGGQSQGMSDAMNKMAQGMSQEGMSDDGQQGMDKLAGELSDAEMLEGDMQNMDAALQECKKQLAKLGDCLGGQSDGQCQGGGIGAWKPGSSNRNGNGTGGGGGHGHGVNGEEEPVDFAIEKNKANTQTREGPIIGQRLVYADQIRGQSTAELAQTVEAASQNAADAMEGMQVPRELHGAVKHYFGQLEAKVKAEKSKTPEPPKPAAPAAGRQPVM